MFVDSKSALNTPVVYTWWSWCNSYFMWFYLLWGISCRVLPCSLFLCFSVLFNIVSTSFGKERAGLCASRAFVCLFYTF